MKRQMLGLAVTLYLISAFCARPGQVWSAKGRTGTPETGLAGGTVAGFDLFLVPETGNDATFAVPGFG